jgi:serine/threonine-protein kinase
MAAERLEDGTLLNERYRILRALGSGGMGTVYMAEHLRLDTVVAVKEILGRSGDERRDLYDLAACEREARFLVRLNHPHLPKVTDAFIENDRFYLVMEYIEGTTLEAVVRDAGRRPLEVARVIDWGLQIADVLSYLHAQDPPIIFRDMKPANIMLQPDGDIRLIDFGIARRFQPGANKDTALLGSVGYSPPEQFGKHQTDARSDIYAFAATLHDLLTGRDPAPQPFKFPAARSLNPEVPESLSRLLASCLALEPDQRPASVEEVARGLLAARAELTAAQNAPDRDARSGPPSGRRIVSSQLAQYERRNRAATRRTPNLVPIATWIAIALLATGTATYAVLQARRPRVHHVSRPPVIQIPLPPPERPTVTPAPQDDSLGLQTPPADAATVTLSVGRIVQETDGSLLSLGVRSALHGHAGSVATVAVFVYGPDGTPVPAVDRNSSYANPDGQLSVATRVPITADQQPINVTLSLPLRQFPPPTLLGPVRLRALVTVDGLNFYSEPATVASLITPPDSTAPTPGGVAPGASPGQDNEPATGAGDGSGLFVPASPVGRRESSSGIVGGH